MSDSEWFICDFGFSGGASGRFLEVLNLLFGQFSVNLSDEFSRTTNLNIHLKPLPFKLPNRQPSIK